MKEASGEANKTVIVVVLIGVIAAVGLLLVKRARSVIRYRSCCTEFGGRPLGCRRPEDQGFLCCEVTYSLTQPIVDSFTSCISSR